MLLIYELSSDVAPMSNYLSGELHRAPKLDRRFGIRFIVQIFVVVPR